ncbi:MAG: FecR family protein [Georgfuchsia sp.]
MKLTMTKSGNALSLLLIALVFAASNTFAAVAGEVANLSGTLSVKRADGTSKLLSVKSEVQPGDTLATEAGTYARVKFIDGGEMVLRPGTRVKVDAYSYDQARPAADNQLISLLKGGFRAITGFLGKRNRDKVSYRTPTATIGIRGTNLGAQLDDDNGLHVDVAEGAVVVTNSAGQIEVGVGQFAFVKDGNTLPTLVVDGNKVEVPEDIGPGVGKDNKSSCTM